MKKVMKKNICCGVSVALMLGITACQNETREVVEESSAIESEVMETESEVITSDVVETLETTEESGDEWSEKIPWGDLDGDGTEEYLLLEAGDFLNQNQINGRITMYVNNEPVYQYTDELRIRSEGDKAYVDLDGDGQEEIFVSFWPDVNSADLEEWFVLKKNGDSWERLEMYEDMPITVVLKEKDFGLAIRCEGLDDEIPFDATEHYAAKEAELEAGNDTYTVFMEGNYNENDVVGGTMAYGIWEIIDGEYQGEKCLIALNGISGPMGKYDMYGGAHTYFNYDENGKIKILGMEFEPITPEPIEEALAWWDDGWSKKIPWEDLDGDGNEEYILLESGHFLTEDELRGKASLDDVTGRITMYVNNEPVYQYPDALCFKDVGDKAYVDLDGDGQEEIFVSFCPDLISTDWEQWFVLKKQGDIWERLEIYDDMPISAILKEKEFGLAICCEGWEGEILFDATKHYESAKEQWSDEEGPGPYEHFIAGQYNENDVVGGTMASGIWQIRRGTYQDENCLIALNGICGPMGKYDVYGWTYTYFNYDENGKIKILNVEFEPTGYWEL